VNEEESSQAVTTCVIEYNAIPTVDFDGIVRSKNRKAPGPHEIKAELLFYGSERIKAKGPIQLYIQ
jgi:hypothetical protein